MRAGCDDKRPDARRHDDSMLGVGMGIVVIAAAMVAVVVLNALYVIRRGPGGDA